MWSGSVYKSWRCPNLCSRFPVNTRVQASSHSNTSLLKLHEHGPQGFRDLSLQANTFAGILCGPYMAYTARFRRRLVRRSSENDPNRSGNWKEWSKNVQRDMQAFDVLLDLNRFSIEPFLSWIQPLIPTNRLIRASIGFQ